MTNRKTGLGRVRPATQSQIVGCETPTVLATFSCVLPPTRRASARRPFVFVIGIAMPSAMRLSSFGSGNSSGYGPSRYDRGMRHLSPEAADKVRAAMNVLLRRYETKTALAKALRRSQPAVSDNLNHGTISHETARRVAELMGMSVSALLEEKNAPTDDADSDRDAIRRVARMRGHTAATIEAVLERSYRAGIHPDLLFAEMSSEDRRGRPPSQKAQVKRRSIGRVMKFS